MTKSKLKIEMIEISVQRWSCFALDAFEELCKTFSCIKNILLFMFLPTNIKVYDDFIYFFNHTITYYD